MSHNVEIWISIGIFLITYAFIIWEKFDRAVIALTGAGFMIAMHILNQKTAFSEVDFNTVGLLIGMMIIVMITKRTGLFEYLAFKMVKVAKFNPFKIMILLSLTTGFLSALLDNVTTILLVLPVTISIAKDLKVNPIPYIIAEVFASNVGGTATLVGDPPNIIIGSAVGLSFMDFIKNDAPIAIPLLFITSVLFALMYRKIISGKKEVEISFAMTNEREFIRDKILLRKCITILSLVLFGFLLHGSLGYESATIAMLGAVVLLLISGINPEKIFHEIEWKTIFFFVGLFVLVGGLKETGVIEILAKWVFEITGGNMLYLILAILWVSAIASAFLDNIPFVTTMIPLIQHLGSISGMDVTPLWWALSLGACLGGNGTIIGASANVIAVGIAEEQGYKITFGRFFKEAFPMMILTISIATIYLWIFYV